MRSYAAALLGQLRYQLWVGLRGAQLAVPFILGASVVALAYLGGAHAVPEAVRGLSPGASLWVFVAVMAGITGPAALIEEHRVSGTLEHLHLSPVPLGFLCLARTLAGTVALAPLVAGASLSLALAGGHADLPSLRELAVLGLIFVGSAGTGYVFAGMALLGVRTGPWLGMALLVALALPMLDLARLPVLRALVWVVPASAGVWWWSLAPGAAPAGGPSESAAAALATSLLIQVVAGLATLRWAERQAKAIGSLTRYDGQP